MRNSFFASLSLFYYFDAITLGGLTLQGKTPTGRATIERLKMNQERVVRARRNWMNAGNHPPT
jgi:hypothetical protein